MLVKKCSSQLWNFIMSFMDDGRGIKFLNWIDVSSNYKSGKYGPGKHIGVMGSWESLFKLFQLKTRKCCAIASLFPFLRIFIIQVNIAVIWHWTMSTETCCRARSIVLRRASLTRYVLQFCLLWYAHAGLMERVQSIDVENVCGRHCCNLHNKRPGSAAADAARRNKCNFN